MKKKGWRQYICFLVLLSLTVGLFTGLPAQKVKAEAEKGLYATDWIDWGNDTPSVNPEAEYQKGLESSLLGTTLALQYKENSTDKGTQITASQITAVKVKGEGDEFKETSTASYHENEQNKALTDITFTRCGEYRICYTPEGGEESYVTISARLPELGLYKTQTASDESLLWELNLAESSNEFYMILTKDENLTVTFDSFIVNWDENQNVEDYLKYETVSQGIYKITVNPYSISGIPEGIDLAARGKCTDADGNNWECDHGIHIQNNTGKILQYTDQFKDNWGENGPEEIEDNAEYQKNSLWIDRPYDYWCAFKCEDNLVKAEQLSITDTSGNPVQDVRIWNGSKESIIGMHFPKTGKYILNYKEGDKIAAALEINVNYPSIGFYRSETLSDEGLLTNKEGNDYEFQYGKLKNRNFYLLYGNDENMTISDMKIVTFLRNDSGEDCEIKESDIISYEPLSSNKGYLFTIKENKNEEFYVMATCKKTYRNEDGTTEEYEDGMEMFITPNGLKEDLDLSGVSWNYKEAFTYDGKVKEVVITGLPQGITVSYSNNTATEVGNYTAKASFSYDKELYNEPDFSKISELNWSVVKKNSPDKPVPEKKFIINGITYQITSPKEVSCISGSKKATKVTIPGTVTSNGTAYRVTAIADNAFAGNSRLSSVKISDNVKKIGKNAFARCSKLKKITIPKNVTEIGQNVWKDCKKLTQVTFKGTKVKKIGKNAFKNVSKKIIIKVPKSKKTAYKKLLKKAGYKKTIK